MTAINGSCKHREQLWERWIDACSELAEVSEAERTKEQGIRHLLNDHMKKHQCGFPVSEPKANEKILEMFAEDSGIDEACSKPPPDWPLKLL